MAEALRIRPKEAMALLGCSKSYLRDLVRRGKLTAYKESPRYCFFRRADVEKLCGVGIEEPATRDPAPMLTEKPIPQIINEPQTSPKRRGRPRKQRLEVR